MYSKNSNNFKVIDYNNTILTLNSGEHYLIKLDKKYKDKMLSITREDGIKDDFYYKFIILTSERNVPSFDSSFLAEQFPFSISFEKLDNGLLEEENYYLFFELIKGGDFDFSFGNKVAKRDDADIYKIKKDQNYVFKFNYSAANSFSDFVQVIPCENSEIKILEKTKSETNVNTISNYYSFRMNRFKDRINVYGNSYIMFYPEYVIINFNYLTSLNVADLNSTHIKISFIPFLDNKEKRLYKIIQFNSSSIAYQDACQLYDINDKSKNTTEYLTVKEFNSSASYITEYIPKNSLNKNNNYFSVIGELTLTYIVSRKGFNVHYIPVKIDNIDYDSGNGNGSSSASSSLAIALGIAIPIIVIALAVIGFILYKKHKKQNSETLNKTEELMPI